MKRLLRTIILVVIALFVGVYLGAYVGKDKLNEYSQIGGKKVLDATKTSCQWVINQCQKIEEKDA